MAPLRSALISPPYVLTADCTVRDAIQLLHQVRLRSPRLGSGSSPAYGYYTEGVIVSQNRQILGVLTPLLVLSWILQDLDQDQVRVSTLFPSPPPCLNLPISGHDQEEAQELCEDPLVLQQALSLMHLHRVLCLPVVGSEGQILGALTPYSLLAATGQESLLRATPIAEVMQPQIPQIEAGITLRKAAQVMLDQNLAWLVMRSSQWGKPDWIPKILRAHHLISIWATQPQGAQLTVKAVASPSSPVLRSDESTWRVIEAMEADSERVFIVQDQSQTPQGAVTPAHLLPVLDQTWSRGTLDPERIWPHIPAAIWVVDQTLRFTLLLGEETSRLGLDPQLHLGQPIDQGFSQAQTGLQVRFHQQALAGQSVVYEIAAGEHLYLCRLQLLPQGRGVVGIAIRQISSHPAPSESQTLYDPLTQLPNRVWINQQLPELIEQSQQQGQQLALLLLDLDDFKTINDSFDHSTGDRLLQEVAQRLRECLATDQILARLGGDEFLIVMPGLYGERGAVDLAERLLAALSVTTVIEGHEITVTAGLGISLYPSDGENAESLIKHADAAMFRAKANARHSYMLHTGEITAIALDKLTLETRLRKALQGGEFQVFYQPKVEIRSGQIVGAEALLRWRQPELGWVTPGKFIPLAEDLGLLEEIGAWVLEQSCQQVKVWKQAGWPNLRVAVNLSPSQFRQAALAERVAEILEQVGLAPQQLELEITETMAAQDFHHTLSILNRLSRMGVKLSIDDFGTGYSSISYLRRFPVNEIKVDRSFVRDLNTQLNGDPSPRNRSRGTRQDDVAVVSAIIHLAHSLGLEVVAEGVETLEQLELLQELDCDQGQGFFWSRPVPPSTFIRLLEGD